MYGRERRNARDARLLRRRWRFSLCASIESVDPDWVGPGAPPWAVNGDDAEPFDPRRIAPGPFRDFGEFNRRLGESASDAAYRRRSAADERDGVNRRALDPHFLAGEVDAVNARALGGIELAGLQGAEQRLGFERFGFDHHIGSEGVEVAIMEVRVVAGDRCQPPVLVAQLVEEIEPVAPIGQDRAGVIIDLDRMRGAERTPVLDRQLRP